MTPTATAARIGEERPEMSVHELEVWRNLLELRCGVYFAESRLHHLKGCLWERMRAHGLRSYLHYHRDLALLGTGSEEWVALLECLLNRETSFFRCEQSFRALAAVAQEIMSQKRPHSGNILRLWSVGCSSGQEAYSMAIAVLEAARCNSWGIQVRGSDISECALEKARKGRYSARAVEGIPEPLLRRYFSAAGSGLEKSYEVNPGVKALAEFDSLNLVEPATYGAGKHDVIFCQNVLIYFREDVREEIAHQLASRLSPGGYLFFGPGEMAGVKLAGTQAVRIDGSLAHRRVE
jgi:chemotaxis methyl-accepting protein methylase